MQIIKKNLKIKTMIDAHGNPSTQLQTAIAMILYMYYNSNTKSLT